MRKLSDATIQSAWARLHLEEAYRVAEPRFPVLGTGRARREPGRDFQPATPRIAAE
jgi:hypothetical protein